MSKFIDEDYVFNGRVAFNIYPDINVLESMNETIPLVYNIHLLVFVNTVAVTITNFIGSINGQPIRIKGDGNTTIQNNTKIKTNTAANKLLSATKIYSFTVVDNIWYEAE